MTRSFLRLLVLAAAVMIIAALGVACGGTAAVQPEVQTAQQMQPADPEKPQAAQEGADPEKPQAPEQVMMPTPTKIEGFKIGAVAESKAEPTAMPAPEGTIKRGGILNQVHRRSPLHFRLDVRSAIDETTSNAPIFNQLLSLQHPDFVRVGPDIAHTWEVNEASTQYTFQLHDNVVNHNGNPWTSADAKFTLELMTQETENRPPHDFLSVAGESTVESIEAPDETTVIINLKEPDGLLLARLGLQQYSMYTEVDYDEMESLDTPIGTGPYYMESHQPGEKIEFRRHEDYFKDDLPYLDGIDLFIIRDVAAKLAAFEAQRLDYIMMGSSHGMFPENIDPMVDRHPGQITYFPGLHPVLRGIKWNWREEGPWQDKQVRQAINLAINRDQLCEALPNCTMGDYLASTVYGKVKRDELAVKPGFALPGPAKDAEIAQAKQLMVNAGYPDGFEVKSLCRDIADYRDHVCPIVEFILRDTLNIRMSLDVQESGAYVEKHNSADWLFESGASGSARVDHPYDWLDYPTFCGEPPVNNIIGYCNESLDNILKEMRVNSDVEKLKVLADQAMEIFYDDVPYVPLFWPVRYPTHWNHVQNVPDERFSGQYSQARRLEYVWLDR